MNHFGRPTAKLDGHERECVEGDRLAAGLVVQQRDNRIPEAFGVSAQHAVVEIGPDPAPRDVPHFLDECLAIRGTHPASGTLDDAHRDLLAASQMEIEITQPVPQASNG